MAQQEESSYKDVLRLTKREYVIIGIVVFFILLVFLLYIAVFSDGFSNKPDDWGLFGDYFGGTLNPLLSFITIVLLIYTLRIGYKTLMMSKEELEKATEMLKLAKDEIKLTQDALEQSKDEVKLAREATEKQVEHLEKEARKDELARIIKESDLEIQEIFKMIPQSLIIGGGGTFGQVFSATSTIKVSDIQKYEMLTEFDKFRVTRLLVLLINVDNNIVLYKDISNYSVFTQHYQQKFHTSSKKLKDFIPSTDFIGFKILGKRELLEIFNSEQFNNTD